MDGKGERKSRDRFRKSQLCSSCRQTYHHQSNTLKRVWEGPSGRRLIDLFAEGGEGAIRATGRDRPGAGKRMGAGESPPPCRVPAPAGSGRWQRQRGWVGVGGVVGGAA